MNEVRRGSLLSKGMEHRRGLGQGQSGRGQASGRWSKWVGQGELLSQGLGG